MLQLCWATNYLTNSTDTSKKEFPRACLPKKKKPWLQASEKTWKNTVSQDMGRGEKERWCGALLWMLHQEVHRGFIGKLLFFRTEHGFGTGKPKQAPDIQCTTAASGNLHCESPWGPWAQTDQLRSSAGRVLPMCKSFLRELLRENSLTMLRENSWVLCQVFMSFFTLCGNSSQRGSEWSQVHFCSVLTENRSQYFST